MKFYVTIIREGSPPKVGWLAGPFDDEPQARAHIPAARAAASAVDPLADFDAFGTASLTLAPGQCYYRPGLLNKQMGLHTGLVSE